MRDFYYDEPYPSQIEPINYINNLIGQLNLPFENNDIYNVGKEHYIILSETITRRTTANQYLNQGNHPYQDYKILADNYPIDTGTPEAGIANYNEEIQKSYDFLIYPESNSVATGLKDAITIAQLNNKNFWFAVQAHGDDSNRNPSPIEIRCMVNLALAYGAKGIFYYLYGSNADKSGNIGLVNENYVPNDNGTK